jgi:serine protease inhibitor
MPPTNRTTTRFGLLATAGLMLTAFYGDSPPAAAKEVPEEKPVREHKTLKALTPDTRALVESNTDFALHLYGRLAGNQEHNLFFSPYSISSVLAMVVEGARGETAEQAGKVLHYADTFRHSKLDATTPWDTPRIHAGMATLNDHITHGSVAPPKPTRDRLTFLRKQLKAANHQVGELQKEGNWNAAYDVAARAQKLAAEINRLQVQYGQYELRVANALWGEKTYPFRQAYLDTLQKHYPGAGFFPVDFRNDFQAARKRINGWVEEQTHERIKDMISKDVLDENGKEMMRLVLTNAIYFKGEWAEVFQERATKNDAFTLAGGTKSLVPMMHRGYMPGVRYAAFRGNGTFFDTPRQVPEGKIDPKHVYPDENGFALLELSYKGGEVSMVLIVPRSTDGLPALEKNLTAASLQTWVGKLDQRLVHVFLPKFKLETKYALDKALQAMGMVRAFKDPGLSDGAQFDGMCASADPAEKLYISKVLHKAFVEVNEKGTEAAAATAVMMPKKEAAPREVPFFPTFKADRPFVFLIRHVRTGSILFLGRMTNPAEKG